MKFYSQLFLYLCQLWDSDSTSDKISLALYIVIFVIQHFQWQWFVKGKASAKYLRKSGNRPQSLFSTWQVPCEQLVSSRRNQLLAGYMRGRDKAKFILHLAVFYILNYYIKVSGIPSGNKLIKTPHMWRYRWFHLRSFPSIALRIPTAHNFTRD